MSIERTRGGPTEAQHGDTITSPTGSLANSNHSPSSSSVSGGTSFHSHGRTWSKVSDQSRHQPRANRFSVQFPIQPSTSSMPIGPASPSVECTEGAQDVHAALNGSFVPDSNSFLTLIACQERRVLELKEEVQRAEADLERLKRLWAKHEAQKKREDARRLTKLQPLQTSLPAADQEEDANGSSAWMQQEMARRKALLSRSNSKGGRTVIPGQRHTRTLSLLSPDRDNVRGNGVPLQLSPPLRRDSLKNPMRQSLDTAVATARPPLVARGSENSDLVGELDRIADPNIDLTQRASIDQEAILRTSKKVASEFRDGLWTFWEDLKQATVGEEHHAIPPPRRKSSTQTLSAIRKQSSKSSLRPGSRGSSTAGRAPAESTRLPAVRNQSTSAIPDLADPSFWTQFGVPPPGEPSQPQVKKATVSKHARQPSLKKQAAAKRLSGMSNDGWDTWDDSPEQSRSSSSVTSDTNTLPSTVSGSPRSTGISSFEPLEPTKVDSTKRDPIPWPALKKSAGSLRRTASHLMQEWEKSLTPSPGEEFTGQDDYIGTAAEARALGAKKREA
ncbi:hypothetical protein CKM354_001069100 [Cercospora kikuchii]|uniref:DUF4048 domain-containing protein n=1 Tax=Cercospora kikuchii TaxID=84275 RepID=A0A9P3CRH7_9PEZI|nr:uncharacterized protein CKM354_001069100 [Cercospora kikuchii]GIZ47603.1 hypothetical protein CKM354_001069100 [Cercospora kikuchii]